MRAILLLALSIVPPARLAAQSSDSISVFREAAKAEAEYEITARRSAPIGPSSRAGSCDEYVGRFCIYYDSGRDPLPGEPEAISEARRHAIELLRSAFVLNRARQATVFPLIRLLLEDRNPQEALAVADSFSTVTSDVATAQMLLTLTRHAAANIPAAETAIREWLALADSVERERLTSLEHLLSRAERARYRKLGRQARARYDSVFWRYSDPLYLTEGNEVWTEHFARHAEGQLARVAPAVRGSTGWGRDVAELIIRYGTPRARVRIWPGSFGASDPDISELWDPEQMSYAPAELDSALSVGWRPGGGWNMDTVRSTSGHSPPTVRRMVAMEHQPIVRRGADGQHWLRVEGFIVADSAARAVKTRDAQGALYIFDDSVRLLERAPATTRVRGDTIFFSAEAKLPGSAALYSAEVLETGSRLAGRARFRLDMPATGGPVYLSDIFVTEPHEMPSLRPGLIVNEGESFGVYAELTLPSAPDSAVVQLAVSSLDGRPAPLRAVSWLGERLGLTKRSLPTRMGWQIEVTSSAPTPIGVTVNPEGLGPGRYVVGISVVSRSGQRASARREILINRRN